MNWSRLGSIAGAVILPLSSTLALALCVRFPGAAPLAWCALVPLALASRCTTHVRLLYGVTTVAGSVTPLVALDWLRTSDGGQGLSGERALLWLGLGVGLAPIVPFALWLLRRRSIHRWPYVLTLPVAWTTVEFVRFHYPRLIAQTPFPWLQLGGTQIECRQLAQVADLGGVWLVTFLVALVNGALVDVLLARSTSPLRAIGSTVTALAVVLSAHEYGRACLDDPLRVQGPRVALMTPVSSSELLLPQQPASLSDSEMAFPPDLWLWSEMVLEQALVMDQPSLAAGGAYATLADCLRWHAQTQQTALLVGCLRIDARTGKRFNSLVWASCADDRTQIRWYDKQALVPWSEFDPFSNNAEYSHGNQCSTYELSTSGMSRKFNIAPLICFDICFPRLVAQFLSRDQSNRPDLFVAASCESADATGALALAMQTMTRWRAIEVRRPIVRNAEAGLSGLVNSRGEAQVVSDGSGWPLLLPPVPLDDRITFYVAAGDWVPVGCFALLIAIHAVARCPYARSRSSNRISATNSATVL